MRAVTPHRSKGRGQILKLACCFLLTVSLIPRAEAFLGRGSWLEGYGDIFGIYCKDFDSQTTVWHHREITREGVRQSLVKYFQEVPPQNREYNHRYGMTLEEVYQEYYGGGVSPKRFLEAVGDLVDAVSEADSEGLGYQPIYHFHNERFSQSQTLLQDRWRRMVGAAKTGDVSAARYMLGLSLAAIQDFYAHSNWVELGHETILEDLGLPGSVLPAVADYDERTCNDCTQSSCKDGTTTLTTSTLERRVLTSDYIQQQQHSTQPMPRAGKCQHTPHGGGSSPARMGINKDLPTACYSPRHDLHDTAARLAAKATSRYLTVLRYALDDALFLRLLSVQPTPALVIVANVASDKYAAGSVFRRRGTTTLTGSSAADVTRVLTQTFQKLVEQHNVVEYPPEEYILVAYGGAAGSGSVYRSPTPAPLQQILARLARSAHNILRSSQDPLQALFTAGHAAPSGAHVILLTEESMGYPTTRAGTPSTVVQHLQALVLQKRLVVTPIVVSRTAYVTRSPRVGLSLKMLDATDEPNPAYDVTRVLVDDLETGDDSAAESLFESAAEAVPESAESLSESPLETAPDSVSTDDVEVLFEMTDQKSASKDSIGGFEGQEKKTNERNAKPKRTLIEEPLHAGEQLKNSRESENVRSSRLVTVGRSSAIIPSLDYLAMTTGSYLVYVPYGSLDEVSKLISLQQYPEAVLYRQLSSTTPRVDQIPLDGFLKRVRVALVGEFDGASLTSPEGLELSLLRRGSSDRDGVTVVVDTTLFTLVELDMATLRSSHPVGVWELRYSPRALTSASSSGHPSVSVLVTGVTGLDVSPVFYRADGEGLHPSLQRLQQPPAADWRNFVDLVVTGIDTCSVRSVESVSMVEVSNPGNADARLRLATKEPRRNTYVRMAGEASVVTDEPYLLEYRAKDDQGYPLLRQGAQIFTPSSCRLTFFSGREIWGRPGSTLAVSFTLTNSLPKGATFLLGATDAGNFPIVLSQRSVTLGGNESMTLSMGIFIPRRSNFHSIVNARGNRPRNEFASSAATRPFTNTLTLSATPSTGEPGGAAVAHVIVARKVRKDRLARRRGSYVERLEERRRHDGVGKDLNDNPHARINAALGSKKLFGTNSNRDSSVVLTNNNPFQRRPQKDDANSLSRSPTNIAPNPNLADRFGTDGVDESFLISQKNDKSKSYFGEDAALSHTNPQNPKDASVNVMPKITLQVGNSMLDPKQTNLFSSNLHGDQKSETLTGKFTGAALRMEDKTPPTIEVLTIESCGDYPSQSNCDSREWSTKVQVQDKVSGLHTLKTYPESQIGYIPTDTTDPVVFTYTASCCYPSVDVYAADVYSNSVTRTIGEDQMDDRALGAGAISGIVIGAIILLIIIILIIFFVVKRFRGSDKVELRRQKVNTEED